MSCIIESIILFSPEDFPGMEDQRYHSEEITFHPEKIVYRLQNCIDTGTGPDGAFLITVGGLMSRRDVAWPSSVSRSIESSLLQSPHPGCARSKLPETVILGLRGPSASSSVI